MHPEPGPLSGAPATLSVTNLLPDQALESQLGLSSSRSQSRLFSAVLPWTVFPVAPAWSQIPRLFRLAVFPWIVLPVAPANARIPMPFPLNALFWTVFWAEPSAIQMPDPLAVAELRVTVLPLLPLWTAIPTHGFR